MISNALVIIFIIVITFILTFMLKSYEKGHKHLIYRIYYLLSLTLIIWLIALIGMKFTNVNSVNQLYFWDSLTYIGVAFAPAFSLVIALSFVNHYEKMPKLYLAFFVIPFITNIMVWTNPLHHLHYVNFSVLAQEVIFGPYIYFSGLYSYLCMTSAVIIMLNFTIKSQNGLYLKQALMFALSNLIPVIVSALATFKILDLPITATPIAFIITIILHGFSISKLNYLSITPIAMQHVLNWISDCYLVISEDKLILSYNKPFYDIFGKHYDIKENDSLIKYATHENPEDRIGIFNLITSIDSAFTTRSVITYEQSIIIDKIKRYFMAEITPLIINNTIAGYVAIFKDVTRLKESMQRLQNSQNQMMEKERLASLGQMVGGIAHNLKTPIMAIAGAASAMENLVEECKLSFGNKEVTLDDYQEIYEEMMGWLVRTRESCAYMSDIISVVKGQATNMNASDQVEFSIDELLKRVTLLMNHEIKSNKCNFIISNKVDNSVLLTGDINNLVQVLNNLISNAIDAQKTLAKNTVELNAKLEENFITISVKDYGVGVPYDVADKLFKEMVTSKGSLGTGIGLYMSNVVIRGKFSGTMWYEKNPEGGSTFGFTIPYNQGFDDITEDKINAS
ncbi:MAG: histidine kinase N-terminal 7TM domain-containing protein [Erysipelotrichaceae bacterium]|nr:histidine kinase N-terminal 7TM domain-containing protein [Erysipelotrichaceae bacterium]